MPTLEVGSTGAIVTNLQSVRTNAAPGQWNTTPLGVDGVFGPNRQASVEAFQAWGSVPVDGIVGDLTWFVSFPQPQRGVQKCTDIGRASELGTENASVFSRRFWAVHLCY
jgi:peptidoglycan hydrolase-like protein with peptidoglycan-binding domain